MRDDISTIVLRHGNEQQIPRLDGTRNFMVRGLLKADWGSDTTAQSLDLRLDGFFPVLFVSVAFFSRAKQGFSKF